MKKNNIILIIIFLFLLILPAIDNIFNISPIQDIFEKRKLKSAPKFLENKKFAVEFEEFFNDNYGFRKSLIYLNSVIMDDIFNQSPSNRGVIGEDEWLFFDNNNSLLDAQGLAKIDEKKLEKSAISFIKNWQELQKRKIDYVLVIAADKSSIYPEFLPKYIETSIKNHRIDRFLQILREKSPNFPVIDLREILLEAKKNEIIYHKTDTHWNARGAHYGYVEIMKKLGLKYNSRLDFVAVEDGFYKGDISDIMNIDAKNIDYNLRFKNKVSYRKNNAKTDFYKPNFFINKNENLPILFVYKDSFFDNMLYFFAQNFYKSYFVNEFPCDLDFEIIKSYKPNFVIQQFWEGRIEEIINKCE